MASQPQLFDNGWLEGIKWAHYIGRGSGSDGTDAALGHGPSGNQATFTILVSYEDMLPAIEQICGVYKWNPESKWLDRTIPKHHPAFPWLFANRLVSIKPMKFVGKATFIPLANWSRYSYVMLSILFTQPHYPIMSDAYLDQKYPPFDPAGLGYTVRQEWLRYVERTPTVAGEIFQVEAGRLIYSEGGGGNEPTANTTTVPAPVGYPVTTGDLILLWRQVPYYGLFSPTTGRAENLIAAVNRVNDDTFFGYPTETLLFTGATFSYNETPYKVSFQPGNVLVAGATLGQFPWPSLTVDVALVMKFRDPPAGGATRGWNLQPYAQGRPWFRVKYPSGDAPIPTTTFEKLFTYST